MKQKRGFIQHQAGAGFTLIEILVTISIIGLLTMIGVTNFRVATQRARDGRRQADLEQIRAALELYRADENTYPVDISSGTIVGSAPDNNIYMETVPTDPKDDRQYFFLSDGLTYSLCASLEITTTGSCTALGADCSVGGSSATCNYQVTNPK